MVQYIGQIAPSVKMNPQAKVYTFTYPNDHEAEIDAQLSVLECGDFRQEFRITTDSAVLKVYTTQHLDYADSVEENSIPQFSSDEQHDMYLISLHTSAERIESYSHFSPSSVKGDILPSAPIDQDLFWSRAIEVYPDNSWSLHQKGIPAERGAVRAYYIAEKITTRAHYGEIVPGWS